jgi:ribosomal protein L24E
MDKCKHCHQEIVPGPGTWYHRMGEGSLIMRCDPERSGKPYGINATPTG